MIGRYARSATKNERSIKEQLEACSKVSEGPFIDYIDNGVSGMELEREELTKLMMDASNGVIKKVICSEPARITRDLDSLINFLAGLDQLGVKIEFADGSDPEGDMSNFI